MLQVQLLQLLSIFMRQPILKLFLHIHQNIIIAIVPLVHLNPLATFLNKVISPLLGGILIRRVVKHLTHIRSPILAGWLAEVMVTGATVNWTSSTKQPSR